MCQTKRMKNKALGLQKLTYPCKLRAQSWNADELIHTLEEKQ